VLDNVGIIESIGIGEMIGNDGTSDVRVGKGIVVGLTGTSGTGIGEIGMVVGLAGATGTAIGTILGPSEVIFSGLRTASMTCRRPLHASKLDVRTPALLNIIGLSATVTELPLRRVAILPASKFSTGDDP
jgi:hypothetical protein